MDKKTKEFRKSLEALKGRTAVFREYSHLSVVNVVDVMTSNEEFAITFKLANAKPKDEPINIGSVWSNTSLFKNGFSIAYVGSQMLISQDAVSEFMAKAKSLKSEGEGLELFRTILDGDATEIHGKNELRKFKITFEPTYGSSDDPSKQIWVFENQGTKWKVARTDHFDSTEGKRREKQNLLVSQKSIAKFISILNSTTIPIRLQFDMGCDGSFTELEYGGYGGGMKLRWWSPPKELEALDKAINELLEELIDA